MTRFASYRDWLLRTSSYQAMRIQLANPPQATSLVPAAVPASVESQVAAAGQSGEAGR